jgi:hypothetical protein
MARRRDKPAGGQVTPPRKRKKLRSGPSRPGNSYEGKSMDGFNNDLMDRGSNSGGMSQPTAGFHSEAPPQPSRQLSAARMNSQSAGSDILHRTTSGTPSAVSSDGNSSFSETADKLLSPQSKNIEDARCEYYHVKNDCDKGIEEVISYLPSTKDDGQRTTLQQYTLLLELRLAKAKLRVDLAVSHRADQYDQQNAIVPPKLAITKGWLDESLRRIETPTTKLDYESGYLFWELSHLFLATILTQHHDSMFEGRLLPSIHEIVDIFQQTEPRAYAPGIGPFLELATGMNNSDPLLMPEILRRLESRMAADTSVNNRRNHNTNSSGENRSQPSQRSARSRAYRSPVYITTDDGIQHEIDPYLDSSPVGNSPAAYRHHYGDGLEEEVDTLQDRNSVRGEVALEKNSIPSQEVKGEDYQEALQPYVVDGVQTERIGSRIEVEELPKIELNLDVDMDHLAEEIHTVDPLPFHEIRDGVTGLDKVQTNNRGQSIISDLSVFDEIMQDVQDFSDARDGQEAENGLHEQPIASVAPVVSQDAHHTRSRNGKPETLVPHTPSRYSIPDSFVMSDDEPEPDSNPFLAAHRVRVATSAAAFEPNAPISSTPVVSSAGQPVVTSSNEPVVCSSEVTRPTIARESEPIVLVSSPARSLTEQLSLAGQSTSRRQSSHIDDSMFISDDDSEEELPPSSNPHLAALVRARAFASTSAAASGSGSNTPTSSASSNKMAKVKLPPHLARVRRAANRTSLDPSSQLATPEEMRILDQEEYPLIDIIDEKVVDGEKKYLIKWKPIHGRRFLDTWEPAENANAASVEDWEIEKARKDKGKAPTKSKKAGERRQKLIEKAATEPAIHEPLPEDAQMFFADTAGGESLTLRGDRSVSVSHTSSSSDQVSSRTRSRANVGDDSFAGSPESTRRLTPEPASDLPPRYAARPFSINAVSPEPIANPALEPLANIATEAAPAASTKIDNSNKYKTQKQQKARMREKREIRRAEKAERLANMTEEKRAELEHSKKMQKMSKRKRKETKAERLAAMPGEERKELDKWLQWKKGVRARTKQDKKNRQANKDKKREQEAQKQAQKAAKSS